MGTATQGFEEVFCAATGISLWRYDNEMNLEYTNSTIPCWDVVFHAAKCAEQAKRHCMQSNHPILIESSLNVFWIAFSGKEDDSHHIYAMGPVLTAETDNIDFNKTLHKLNLPAATTTQVAEAKAALPVINAVRFEEYAILMVFAVRGERISFEDFALKPFDTTQVEKAQKAAVGSHQGSYEYELVMLKDIEDGNINYRVNRSKMAAMVPMPGKMSVADPLRQTKNMIIVQIATCSRAAVKGGLPSEIAFSMSDSYIQSIEAAHTTVEVQAISLAMYDDYVRAVWKTKQVTQYSDAINRCIALIRMHSTEKYTLQQLADEVGYSPYYLSTRFKKETGTGINEFMRQAKIKYAQFLLTDTRQGIKDISDALCFSSPSHFIATFKAETGMTPKQYREAHAKQPLEPAEDSPR